MFKVTMVTKQKMEVVGLFKSKQYANKKASSLLLNQNDVYCIIEKL